MDDHRSAGTLPSLSASDEGQRLVSTSELSRAASLRTSQSAPKPHPGDELTHANAESCAPHPPPQNADCRPFTDRYTHGNNIINTSSGSSSSECQRSPTPTITIMPTPSSSPSPGDSPSTSPQPQCAHDASERLPRRDTAIFADDTEHRRRRRHSSLSSSGSFSTLTSDAEEQGFDSLFFRVIDVETAAAEEHWTVAQNADAGAAQLASLAKHTRGRRTITPSLRHSAPSTSTSTSSSSSFYSPVSVPQLRGSAPPTTSWIGASPPPASQELTRLHQLQEAGKQAQNRRGHHQHHQHHHSHDDGLRHPKSCSDFTECNSAGIFATAHSPLERSAKTSPSATGSTSNSSSVSRSPLSPPPVSSPIVGGRVEVPMLPRRLSRHSPHGGSSSGSGGEVQTPPHPLRGSTGTWTTTHTNRPPSQPLLRPASSESLMRMASSVGELRTRSHEYSILGHDRHTGLLRASSVVEVEELHSVVRRPMALLEQVTCLDSPQQPPLQQPQQQAQTTAKPMFSHNEPRPPATASQGGSRHAGRLRSGWQREAVAHATKSSSELARGRGSRRHKNSLADVDGDGDDHELEDERNANTDLHHTNHVPMRMATRYAVEDEEPFAQTQPSVRLRREAEARFSATFSGFSDVSSRHVLRNSWMRGSTPNPLNNIATELQVRNRTGRHEIRPTNLPSVTVGPTKSGSITSLTALASSPDVDDSPLVHIISSNKVSGASVLSSSTIATGAAAAAAAPALSRSLLANTPILDISELLVRHSPSATAPLSAGPSSSPTTTVPLFVGGLGARREEPLTPDMPSITLTSSVSGSSSAADNSNSSLVSTPHPFLAQCGSSQEDTASPRQPDHLSAPTRAGQFLRVSPERSSPESVDSVERRSPSGASPYAGLGSGAYGRTPQSSPLAHAPLARARASPLFPDDDEEEENGSDDDGEDDDDEECDDGESAAVTVRCDAASTGTPPVTGHRLSIPSPPSLSPCQQPAPSAAMTHSPSPSPLPQASGSPLTRGQIIQPVKVALNGSLLLTDGLSMTNTSMGLSGSAQGAPQWRPDVVVPNSAGQLLRFAPIDLTGSVRMLNISHNSTSMQASGSFSTPAADGGGGATAQPSATTASVTGSGARHVTSPPYFSLSSASSSGDGDALKATQAMPSLPVQPDAAGTPVRAAADADLVPLFTNAVAASRCALWASTASSRSDQSPLSSPVSPNSLRQPHEMTGSLPSQTKVLRVNASDGSPLGGSILSGSLSLPLQAVGVPQRVAVPFVLAGNRTSAGDLTVVRTTPTTTTLVPSEITMAGSGGSSGSGGPLSSVDSDPLCPGDLDDRSGVFSCVEGTHNVVQWCAPPSPDAKGARPLTLTRVSPGASLTALSASTTSHGSGNPLSPDDDD